jgi:hypothetical protein
MRTCNRQRIEQLASRLALGITMLVIAGALSTAQAIPRGKRPPRSFAPATSPAPAVDNHASVGRPDASCKVKKDPLTYHDGKLVQHPDVFLLFWGSLWTGDAAHLAAKTELEALYTQVVTSEYACAWQEYSVPAFPLGTGTYAGSYVIASDPPNPVQDADIQSRILAEAGVHAPPRSDDEVYVVVVQSGTPVVAGDGTTGCGGSNFKFCGYHDSFSSDGHYRYEVLPFPCSIPGQGTCFVDPADSDIKAAFDVVASHELTELVTDPDSDPPGWNSDRDGQENADICHADACTYDLTIGLETFTVNSAWSNLAGGCVATVPCPPRPIGCTDPSPGACTPGSSQATDCALEWQVDPNLTTKKGLPGSAISCQDGQDFCDADGAFNGQCTFQVALCLNNQDPRLPQCVPTSVSSVTLRKPDLADPIASTLLTALTSLSPGGSASGSQVTYSPDLATPNACTSYVNVVVPAGEKRKLSAELRTGGGKASSKLTLTCQP